MKRSRSWKMRGSLLALAIFAVAAGVAGPALADEHHWRGDRHEHHWRGHRDWDRGGVYVGPSYGYYDGYYAYPPPPVVYPQPGVGFSINIH